MPNQTIVNKDAVGGNQLIKASTPVLAAATSVISFISSITHTSMYYQARPQAVEGVFASLSFAVAFASTADTSSEPRVSCTQDKTVAASKES